MDTGIGKDGYSVIGQGRIDEILSKIRMKEEKFLKKLQVLLNTEREKKKHSKI